MPSTWIKIIFANDTFPPLDGDNMNYLQTQADYAVSEVNAYTDLKVPTIRTDSTLELVAENRTDDSVSLLTIGLIWVRVDLT